MRLLVFSLAVTSSLGTYLSSLSSLPADVLHFIPNLQNLTRLADASPETVMAEIARSPLRAMAPEIPEPEEVPNSAQALPTVTAHGMGDSCFEPGMASITRGIAKKTGSYARCVPTAGNIITDTIDGFLKNMDSSVEYFAAKIRSDPELKGGFNAVGFSQGNSLIRGYIQKYNDPPVHSFLSVHGTVMGVSQLPGCFEQGKPLGLICKALAEVLGDLAYLPFAQSLLFQADYYREPQKVSSSAYLKRSQIGHWNNEDPKSANTTYKANFGKTQKFAMVKALQDSMVYPNEGEWWGSFADGSYTEVLPMKQTKFYREDLFGLKTADEAGKIHYETTPGDHLQFTAAELYGWVQKYFMDEAAMLIV